MKKLTIKDNYGTTATITYQGEEPNVWDNGTCWPTGQGAVTVPFRLMKHQPRDEFIKYVGGKFQILGDCSIKIDF